MIIRSQDKEILAGVDNNFYMTIDKYAIGNDKYKCVVRFNGYPIGEYSTMEKAKKVLSEIELDILAKSEIFIMPQDDEMEVRKNEF